MTAGNAHPGITGSFVSAESRGTTVQRTIVLSIYTLGFWTVTGIIAAKTGTFPVEMFLLFSTGFGAILTAMKEKDSKSTTSTPEEKS